MEAKNIMLVGVWAFAMVWLLGTFVVRADALVALVIFFIAIGVSATTIALPTSSTQVGA